MSIKSPSSGNTVWHFHPKWILGVSLFCAAGISVAFLFYRLVWQNPRRSLWEGAAIGLVLIFFFSLKPVQDFFRCLPRIVKTFYIVLFFFMYTGQMITVPRLTFPFMPWQMFSTTLYSTEIITSNYFGLTADGKAIPIYPEKYFRSLANGRLVTDIDNLARSLYKHDEKAFNDKQEQEEQINLSKDMDQRTFQGTLKRVLTYARIKSLKEYLISLDEKKRQLEKILIALLKRHNAMYPRQPIVQIQARVYKSDVADRPHMKETQVAVYTFGLTGENP